MEEDDDYMPLTVHLEMTSRLVGRITALEAMMQVLLSEKPDLENLAQKADKILLHSENSRIVDLGHQEETIQSHEWARQSLIALMENTKIARKLT